MEIKVANPHRCPFRRNERCTINKDGEYDSENQSKNCSNFLVKPLDCPLPIMITYVKPHPY